MVKSSLFALIGTAVLLMPGLSGAANGPFLVLYTDKGALRKLECSTAEQAKSFAEAFRRQNGILDVTVVAQVSNANTNGPDKKTSKLDALVDKAIEARDKFIRALIDVNAKQLNQSDMMEQFRKQDIAYWTSLKGAPPQGQVVSPLGSLPMVPVQPRGANAPLSQAAAIDQAVKLRQELLDVLLDIARLTDMERMWKAFQDQDKDFQRAMGGP